TPGLEVYGNEERVHAGNLKKGPWQAVTIKVHSLAEVQTPGFEMFLKEAVASFEANVKRMQTKPEDLMPWKLNGEKWHLGEKGFPPGRKLRWDRAALPRLLQVIKEVDPALEVQWANRDSVSFKVPDAGRSWAHLRTKDSDSLKARFLGKKGQFNL